MILLAAVSIISINLLQDNYYENSKKLNQIIEKHYKINTSSKEEKRYTNRQAQIKWRKEDQIAREQKAHALSSPNVAESLRLAKSLGIPENVILEQRNWSVQEEKAHTVEKNPLLERWKVEARLASNNEEYISLKQKNNIIKIFINIFTAIMLLSIACISVLVSVFVFKHIYHYIKNNIIYKMQRIGIVLLCFGIFLMIWAWVLGFFSFDGFPGKYIADTSELYGIIFFSSLFLIIISIAFISCLFQKIYKWINDGK